MPHARALVGLFPYDESRRATLIRLLNAAGQPGETCLMLVDDKRGAANALDWFGVMTFTFFGSAAVLLIRRAQLPILARYLGAAT